MPSYANFFNSAAHKINKLRMQHPLSPRKTAFLMMLWSLEKAALGHVTGDYHEIESKYTNRVLNGAIYIRGGVGDTILSINFLYNLAEYAEFPINFDTYTSIDEFTMRSLCYEQSYISNNYSIKYSLQKKYDFVADITHMAWFPQMNSRKIFQYSKRLFEFIKNSNEFRQRNLMAFSDEGQRIGMDYANVVGAHRQSQMDMSGALYLKKNEFCLRCEDAADAIRKKFGLFGPFITLHRESGNEGPSSFKLWPVEKYQALMGELRRLYPDASLVFLGANKDNDMSECLDLRSETSFSELKVLVKEATLHIGGEGIIPHLRHFLRGGPSVVLFGPTSSRRYGYPENINIHGKECPEGCEWITQTWQSKCIKGYDYCRCMAGISVDMVMQEISGHNGVNQMAYCVSGEGR